MFGFIRRIFGEPHTQSIPVKPIIIGIVDPFTVGDQAQLMMNREALLLMKKFLEYRIAIQFNSLRRQGDNDESVECRQGALEGMIAIRNGIEELIARGEVVKKEEV